MLYFVCFLCTFLLQMMSVMICADDVILLLLL